MLSIGVVFIFLGINALAIAVRLVPHPADQFRQVFPKSLIFPFVLTFCGISLIYLGMNLERAEIGELFQVQLTGHEGTVARWTQQLANFVARFSPLARAGYKHA